MAVAPPSPTIDPTVISKLPHFSVTVWLVPKVTLLVIFTVAVAGSPPSVSSVTGSPLESVSVNSQVGASVVTITLASFPLPPTFSARTSKV